MKKLLLSFTFILLLWGTVFPQLIVNKVIYKANFSNIFHSKSYTGRT